MSDQQSYDPNNPPVWTGPDGRQYTYEPQSWADYATKQQDYYGSQPSTEGGNAPAPVYGPEDHYQRLQEQWKIDQGLQEKAHPSAYNLPYIPDYQPTFWDHPINVARAYHDILAAPPDALPNWATPELAGQVTQLYDYYKNKNAGKPFTDWNYLAETDPVRQVTQQMPDLSVATQGYNIPADVLAQIQAATPEQLAAIPADVMKFLPPEIQKRASGVTSAVNYTPATPDLVNGMPRADWEKLPEAEKVMYWAAPKLSSPVGGAGVVTRMGVAVAVSVTVGSGVCVAVAVSVGVRDGDSTGVAVAASVGDGTGVAVAMSAGTGA